ncbi:hypothetical protein RHSIM_Rhsim12G0089600 [Rhododendron simsii]|uniref:GRAM domain-containing protein n=1 Tax=Rhododendron simsii TaxID=118357 RepID=A0A834G8H5_RHOSS|nr:hypothetical protein RHSIM_Rhsim12G0089600 [Rhododendron simsii]
MRQRPINHRQPTCCHYAHVGVAAQFCVKKVAAQGRGRAWGMSERSIKFSPPTGEFTGSHYKINNRLMAQVVEISVTSVGFPAEKTPKRLLVNHITSSSTGALMVKKNKVDRTNKLGGKAGNLANGIREHVRLGPKIAETVKGKVSLGTKILKAGGIEKLFKHHFSVREGEKLLKVSQCYLSTTAGPIAGLLFISTDKVAFCSERSIITSSPTGELRIRYKVLIPIGKILRANESQHMKRPSQKFIYVVTEDNFDFWFMGFLNFRKTFKRLQQALSQDQ